MKMKPNSAVFNICKESGYNEFAASLLELKFQDLQKSDEKINIALSGGSTPIPIFQILRNADLLWERFNFFLVDERCVPIDSDNSNFKNINEVFFKHIGSNAYPMLRKDVDDLKAISLYQESLLSELNITENGTPQFDLILLGMGEDGHVASLFPNSEALEEKEKLVVKNFVPQLDSHRITLTYPIFKNAREAIVLIKGLKKRKIVDQLYASEAKQYPMYGLIDSSLILNWIISE